MAWVIRRTSAGGRVRHQGMYRDPSGRQRSAGNYSTERQALRAATRAEAAIESGTWFAREVWWPSLHLEPRTKAAYKSSNGGASRSRTSARSPPRPCGSIHSPRTCARMRRASNVRKGVARRHVVSAFDLGQHYMAVLNKSKVSMARLLLEERGSGPGARERVKAPFTRQSIKEAAVSRYEVLRLRDQHLPRRQP
jgi:hypothetical protein